MVVCSQADSCTYSRMQSLLKKPNTETKQKVKNNKTKIGCCLYNGLHFSIIWKDTKNESDGLGNTVNLVMNDSIDILFGSPSSSGTS